MEQLWLTVVQISAHKVPVMLDGLQIFWLFLSSIAHVHGTRHIFILITLMESGVIPFWYHSVLADPSSTSWLKVLYREYGRVDRYYHQHVSTVRDLHKFSRYLTEDIMIICLQGRSKNLGFRFSSFTRTYSVSCYPALLVAYLCSTSLLCCICISFFLRSSAVLGTDTLFRLCCALHKHTARLPSLLRHTSKTGARSAPIREISGWSL